MVVVEGTGIYFRKFVFLCICFFFFNDTATTEIYTLSLHDALPISGNDIALKVIGKPLGNTVLLGAYAAATGEIKLEGLNQAIKKRFSGKIADLNIEAAKQGYEYIKKQ